MASNLRALAVCTHNRTRSVMMAALFAHHADAAGLANVTLSGGFSPADLPPTDGTVRLLAAHGIDVAGHRSRSLDDQSISDTDLVFTAEQAHVVSIAGRWPHTFGHTFTLPELVTRGEAVGRRGSRSLSEWLDAVNADRPTALDYLDAVIDEIDDPTGGPPVEWKVAFERIDALTRRLATLLA